MIRLFRLREEDLCRPEILAAARSNRVILLADTNREEDKVLIQRAIKIIKSCWKYVRPGVDLNLVRLYLNGIMDSRPKEFREAMAHERKYAKYLSEIIGALLQHRVFQCSTNVLAKCVGQETKKEWTTIERYLYQGMKEHRLVEIFMAVDVKITNNQFELCTRER